MRADVGSPMAIKYRVESADAPRAGLGGIVGDIGRLAIGGRSVSLATLEFELPWHREARLIALASRVGATAIVAHLWFDVVLERPVDVPVTFKAARLGSGGSFVGGASAARLAAVPDLVKRVGKVLRPLTMFGTIRFETEPSFVIEPDEAGSRMRIATLTHTSGLLVAKSSTDAGEVLAIAKAIEAALPATA